MNEFWQTHLLAEGAEFADGRVTSFPSAAQSAIALCDLSHYGVIEVAGEDAASFLHAQLTNDVLTQEHSAARWNAWCSPKGRMLVSFLQWREEISAGSGTTIGLLTPRALQPAIQKRLGMFVLRAKAKIRDASDDVVLFGLAGSGAQQLAAKILNADSIAALGLLGTTTFAHAAAQVRTIALSAQRLVFACPALHADAAISLWKTLRAHASASGANAWTLAGVRDGIAEIAPTSQELFVPQMVNLELTGGVSFKKGCYPGQEIVARTQYRGILKRRMVRVSFAPTAEPTTLPLAGDPVYSPAFGDQACGNIVNVARTESGLLEALVVAQLDAINAVAPNGLFADAACKQPMKILPLPYNVPELTTATV